MWLLDSLPHMAYPVILLSMCLSSTNPSSRKRFEPVVVDDTPPKCPRIREARGMAACLIRLIRRGRDVFIHDVGGIKNGKTEKLLGVRRAMDGILWCHTRWKPSEVTYNVFRLGKI